MSNQPINDGGLAFPQPMAAFPDSGEMFCAFERSHDFAGMTLRDYFAGQALAALSTKIEYGVYYKTNAAKDAYEIADAMIEARQQTKPQL
jgi:hypothetical protein